MRTKRTPNKCQPETPGDDGEEDAPNSVCIHEDGACDKQCLDNHTWANMAIPSQMRRTLAKPIDLAWMDENGSSTDPLWRDRTCRRAIKYLSKLKYADDWRELFKSENPYETNKGMGLDLMVRKKA
jgi:hypothetical protein